ncbi:MAG TPA: 4-hydroxythreonine-4-phosphate dehydrogenase PdxA, partial [Vicinamibacteria bacterium]|nr:4-hydroxythreonine-4-phosphate dehydrogenase PdxA [Vicinamibacteria bacterium]
AVTAGDPAGIGPEVVLKALASPARPQADVVVFGPAALIDARARRFSLPALGDLGVEVVDVPALDEVRLGHPSLPGGRVAAEAVVAAARAALAGQVAGLVTAPISKEALHVAGYTWPGHTEILAEVSGVRDFAMMFVGGGLRVALLTMHQPLRTVPESIRTDLVTRVVRLVDRELPRFGGRGTIALCGLNPHAGEGGLLGSEEHAVLAPAVAILRAEGIDVAGPLPADTVFVRAVKGEFAAVVAGYHDQGLIPVKLASFGKAVNVTLGLPFVRTSVDHGTGFDIVEKGIASESSLLEAMRLAVELTSR